MHPENYWAKQHTEYATKNWIDKTTLFAQFAVIYFPPKGKILELGAGQGQDSRFFAKKGFDVTSTDLATNALQISKIKAEKENLQINFQELDLTKKLPNGDATFDVVYSHLALHYFDIKTTQQIIDEVARILTPNGILAFLVNTIEDSEVNEYQMISEDFYQAPYGITKRYFNTTSVEILTKQYFETLLLDAKGQTYKDKIKSLIRFIGKKK